MHAPRPCPIDPASAAYIGWWSPSVGGGWVPVAAADTDLDAWAALLEAAGKRGGLLAVRRSGAAPESGGAPWRWRRGRGIGPAPAATA
jgi:hypothetical protein